MSVAVLNAMNTRGRAAICGAISHYNEVILMLRVLMLNVEVAQQYSSINSEAISLNPWHLMGVPKTWKDVMRRQVRINKEEVRGDSM